MGLKDQPLVDPYGLSPDFETALVAAVATRPKLYGRLGHALDPTALGQKRCRVVLEAVQSIAHEVGHGPISSLHVVQRLKRLHTNGVLEYALLLQAVAVFDDADDQEPLDDESFITEMKPIVQSSLRRRALREGVKEYGVRRDLKRIVDLEAQALRVGEADVSIGARLGSDAVQEITDYLALERLETGIDELDALMDGGLVRQTLGMLIGDSGAGKSQGLSQITTHAGIRGVLSCYATIEIPRPLVLARMVADLTRTPTNMLLREPGLLARSVARLVERGVSTPVVQRFPSGTTVPDLVAWLDNVEQTFGIQVGLLTVDYGDKLGAPGRASQNTSSYDLGKQIWEGLHDTAEYRNMWVWTATQAKEMPGVVSSKKVKKVLKQNAACDSKWKPRTSDAVVTINPDDMQETVRLYLAKFRQGVGERGTEPLPTDYAYGRLVVSNLDEMS